MRSMKFSASAAPQFHNRVGRNRTVLFYGHHPYTGQYGGVYFHNGVNKDGSSAVFPTGYGLPPGSALISLPSFQPTASLNSFAAFGADIQVARYSPGGDIYASVSHTYGTGVANQVASAAAAGDRNEISHILGQAATGADLGNTSTADNFVSQMYNNPLAAPIEAADNVITGAGSAFSSASGLKAVAAIGGLGLALYFLLKLK